MRQVPRDDRRKFAAAKGVPDSRSTISVPGYVPESIPESAPDSSLFTASVWTPQVTSGSAIIKVTFLNPRRIHVKMAGCNIYDSSGKLMRRHTEACSRRDSRFCVIYDTRLGPGLKLKSKTTYQYEFFISHEGIDYVTSRLSFTTK